MSRAEKRALLASVLRTLITGTCAMIAAGVLIRHLSVFLSGAPQFRAIFEQLGSARIGPPVWSLLPAWGLDLLIIRLRRCKPLVVLLWVLWGLGFLVAVICCTAVNGILFGDVLVSLLEVMSKGGFDGL